MIYLDNSATTKPCAEAVAAMTAMGEVTGATVREDITARIFERFCVGK